MIPAPLIPALGGGGGSDVAAQREEYEARGDRSSVQSEDQAEDRITPFGLSIYRSKRSLVTGALLL